MPKSHPKLTVKQLSKELQEVETRMNAKIGGAYWLKQATRPSNSSSSHVSTSLSARPTLEDLADRMWEQEIHWNAELHQLRNQFLDTSSLISMDIKQEPDHSDEEPIQSSSCLVFCYLY